MYLSPGVSVSSTFLCESSSRYLWLHVLDFPLVREASFFRNLVLSFLSVYIHSLMPACPIPIHKPAFPPRPSPKKSVQVGSTASPDSISPPSALCVVQVIAALLSFTQDKKQICRSVISRPNNQFLGWWGSRNQCVDFDSQNESLFDSESEKIFIMTKKQQPLACWESYIFTIKKKKGGLAVIQIWKQASIDNKMGVKVDEIKKKRE